MTVWRDIETLTPRIPGEHRGVDLYSCRRNIRWTECFFSDGQWISRHKFVDDEGRRVASFHRVCEPTHWAEMPELPRWQAR